MKKLNSLATIVVCFALKLCLHQLVFQLNKNAPETENGWLKGNLCLRFWLGCQPFFSSWPLKHKAGSVCRLRTGEKPRLGRTVHNKAVIMIQAIHHIFKQTHYSQLYMSKVNRLICDEIRKVFFLLSISKDASMHLTEYRWHPSKFWLSQSLILQPWSASLHNYIMCQIKSFKIFLSYKIYNIQWGPKVWGQWQSAIQNVI